MEKVSLIRELLNESAKVTMAKMFDAAMKAYADETLMEDEVYRHSNHFKGAWKNYKDSLKKPRR